MSRSWCCGAGQTVVPVTFICDLTGHHIQGRDDFPWATRDRSQSDQMVSDLAEQMAAITTLATGDWSTTDNRIVISSAAARSTFS